ncbi:hypothetical protein [Oceanispirochaeta sp.]|nr:hypothetical protein [Oceanispirochaeta sp.]MDA3955795.1 hypothetical protein [Oceanispirochaeta sp.]
MQICQNGQIDGIIFSNYCIDIFGINLLLPSAGNDKNDVVTDYL